MPRNFRRIHSRPFTDDHQLDFLTTQTGYEFVYRKGVLNTGEKVTLELKEATADVCI